MDMRNLNNLIIKKAILHILNNKDENIVLNDFELDLIPQIENIFKKHIQNSINDEGTRIAKFKNETNAVRQHCQNILDDSDSNFVSSSQEIARHLFDAMQEHQNISPANFVVCLYSTDIGNFIALLKMDFSEIIETEVKIIEGKTKISVLVKGSGLPNEKQKLQKCVFFKPYIPENEYDLILLDKQAIKAKKDDLIANFFTNNFLHCELAKTNRDITRGFKTQTEKFIENKFANDIEKIEELKNLLVSTLKAADSIDINSFAESSFGYDNNLKQEYMTLISEKLGDFNFEVDKDWVKTNLRKKKYKTNTGIEINVDVDTAQNPDKFAIKRNDDNTFDIIIKNVQKYSEKIV
jgi:hypothetical protein